jgi:hypothetical protein
MFPCAPSEPPSASHTMHSNRGMLTDLIARPVVCLCANPPASGCSCYTGPLQRLTLVSESAARPTSQRVVWHLRAQIVPRVWTRPRNYDVHKNKKVPRREARHCSVRGRSSRRVDQARAKSKPKTPIALAVITAPTSRALWAGRDVGDDPLSPDGHGPRDFDAVVHAAVVQAASVHAALAFATWVAIASISAGDRQS